jgi:hypothetical protein
MITWLFCTLHCVCGTYVITMLVLYKIPDDQNYILCVCVRARVRACMRAWVSEWHMPFTFSLVSFRLDMVYTWLVCHDFLSQTIIFLCCIVDQEASASVYMSSDLHVHFVESWHAVDLIINWANIIRLHLPAMFVQLISTLLLGIMHAQYWQVRRLYELSLAMEHIQLLYTTIKFQRSTFHHVHD